MSAEWHPMETAARDGTRIDLWVTMKTEEGMAERRIPDAFWGRGSGYWLCDSLIFPTTMIAIPEGFMATHWMHISKGPFK